MRKTTILAAIVTAAAWALTACGAPAPGSAAPGNPAPGNLGHAAAATRAGLQQVGPPDAATVSDNREIQLHADTPATGGAIGAPRTIGSADAVMVLLDVRHAAPQAVTLALLDAKHGDTVGYWQNATDIESATPTAALLDLSRPTPRVRLFAGTHDQTSDATVRLLDIAPVRRTIRYHTRMYGSAVSAEKWVAQSFTAKGSHLAGLTVHTSLPDERTDKTPDLLVRLFAWDGNVNDTRDSAPLAQTLIPNSLVPAGRPLGRDIDLFIPLRAAIKPGRQYLIDFTCPSTDADTAQRYLLWCGPNGYDGGEQFIDGRSPASGGWDLNMDVYEEAR